MKREIPEIEKLELPVGCNACGEKTTITVSIHDLVAYQTRGYGGRKIQDIFPYLSASERELIISGTCGTCWEQIFLEDYETDVAECEACQELNYVTDGVQPNCKTHTIKVDYVEDDIPQSVADWAERKKKEQ